MNQRCLDWTVVPSSDDQKVLLPMDWQSFFGFEIQSPNPFTWHCVQRFRMSLRLNYAKQTKTYHYFAELFDDRRVSRNLRWSFSRSTRTECSLDTSGSCLAKFILLLCFPAVQIYHISLNMTSIKSKHAIDLFPLFSHLRLNCFNRTDLKRHGLDILMQHTRLLREFISRAIISTVEQLALKIWQFTKENHQGHTF